jgi:hypothetical protein
MAHGRQLDTAAHVFSKRNRRPRPGSITICFDCGHVMAFDERLRFRELNDKEIYDLAGECKMLRLQEAIAERSTSPRNVALSI